MNYINEMKKAIDYIENNLDKDINFEKVSKEVGMSSFYFHRIFTAIIGISPTAYIRNRRLTVAAQEISKNNADAILDINNCLIYSETNGVTGVIKYGNVNSFDEMSIWKLSDTSYGNTVKELNKF